MKHTCDIKMMTKWRGNIRLRLDCCLQSGMITTNHYKECFSGVNFILEIVLSEIRIGHYSETLL